jgi:hypothetical protein
MNQFANAIGSIVEEICRVQDYLRDRDPADRWGFQERLDVVRRRAVALSAGADEATLEAIEVEFYGLIESTPDIRNAFRRQRDFETTEILLRALQELQCLSHQRPLTEQASEAMRETQSLYDKMVNEIKG